MILKKIVIIIRNALAHWPYGNGETIEFDEQYIKFNPKRGWVKLSIPDGLYSFF